MQVVERAEMDATVGIAAARVSGHAREVWIGVLAGRPLVLLLGRYHLYQGLTPSQVAAPIRALEGTGVRTVVLTNAAGGINLSFQIGDLMLITDHVNLPGLAGQTPLMPPIGGEVEFVPMRDAYAPTLRAAAREAASAAGVMLREGVYAMVAGPSYETAAELRMLRMMGADAVGMSTVPEVLAARAMGMDVLGISTITNRAVPEEDVTPSHEEVLREGARATASLRRLLTELVPRL